MRFKKVSGTVKIKPLSTNKMYTGVKRRSVWYRSYEKKVLNMLRAKRGTGDMSKGNYKLELEIGVSSPLFDASNAIKPFEDCLSKHYGFNDKCFALVSCRKFLVKKGQEYITYTISAFRGVVDRRKK